MIKASQIGLIFALIFDLALVTSAKTLPQSLPTEPLQQNPKVPFSEEELLNASPFDSSIQVRTFHAVAKIMNIKQLDPEIEMPALVLNTSVPVEKIADYIGFDLGSNQIHYFGYLKNTILLSKNAKIHNLAHEMAHYFQFHYELKGDMKNLVCDPEPGAIRVQDLFRADQNSITARFSN